MSGESLAHVQLVEGLIRLIGERHRPARGLVVFADHHRFGLDRPPRIGGHLPDVFASDLPMTFRLIGEAKTASDLETDRSLRQLTAFLDHLSLYPGSGFYLAVPHTSLARARFVLKSLTSPEHVANVDVTITCCAPC